jgi:hypothetical protein
VLGNAALLHVTRQTGQHTARRWQQLLCLEVQLMG